ncbi:CoA transferase [Thalassobaculum sp. OXR-137]|uniref:CaiB/BaiF CoA transferase family protein n=1 Tax=Thalassobaculum sp. OXR-137 TaxID=3100173 RepID=UPI002AC8B14F|nr:CoA transferase [Thalassobaculum sp. OXR-137]WPZ36561.1 CoA transferase [Thalassobaculum sp. OXR-137]
MSGVEKEWVGDIPGALHGVRVLDMSRLVAGNAVTHLLADHGAEVIKIEKPDGGDDLRAWNTEGVTTHWKVICRNKKSVTLNFRQEGAIDLMLDLVASARVLVENFKPGTLEKMGIGPDVLLKRNPNLIIIRISGWGQDGMWSHRPGFGSLVEAMSGFAAMNGFADRPPVLPPLALADMIAGLYGAFSAMVAIREIEVKNGPGQVIDLSLFEPIHSVLGPIVANYDLTQTVPERTGSLSNQSAPRNVYQCKDGKYVALSASMQAMAHRLLRTIGRGDLVDNPKFRTNTDRVANRHELDPIVAAFMAERTQEENLAIFEEAGVTVGAVPDVSELAVHPYPLDREAIVSMPDADIGRMAMHNVIPRMSGSPAQLRMPAPELGEHNEEIWPALGHDTDALRAKGLI